MKIERKGIILAGGQGTRLYPLTLAVSKQLMPVYDKPMIYYPLSTLMLANIRKILIISCPNFIDNFKSLLGDGTHLGLEITYECQKKPEGIAQAFLIGEKFLDESPSALILGDNLFHGVGLSSILQKASMQKSGGTVFACKVNNPRRYGVVDFKEDGQIKSILEKPINPPSKYAVTGIYFYDKEAVKYAKELVPSERGELEITMLNKMYIEKNKLNLEIFGRGISWFDTGTFDSLHEASSYIKAIDSRHGLKVSCPEEISWRKGWINSDDLKKLSLNISKNSYGKYLLSLLEGNKN